MTKLCLIALILMANSCSNNDVNILTAVKKIENFPSASGIEYANNRLYIIGDDATQMLVLDTNFQVTDSIPLLQSGERRLPKATKPDLEAITLLPDNKLLVLGSGSLSPYRNKAWMVDPISKKIDSLNLGTFYETLSVSGLPEINIEGLCTIPGYFILANRGNVSYPKNHLIVASKPFWISQQESPITLIRLGNNTDSIFFKGVSGLSYSEKSDKLLVTISTEDTKSNYDDGAIGKSYLWIIDNFSAKIKWAAINPDKILELEKIDNRFQGQKIESVCITEETKSLLHLVLVADNDDGSSTLFKMIVEKG